MNHQQEIKEKQVNLDKQKIVHIGDTSYLISPFLTSKGLRIKAKIIKYCGSSLAQAMGAEDESTILELIATVFTDMSEDQYVELIKEILSGVTKNNMPVDFENEFQLNYGNLFKLIKEVLEFNYRDVFSLLGINVT